MAISLEDIVTTGEYGPAFYQGRKWAGCITEVFLEFWKLGANEQVEQQGNRIDLLDKAQDSIQITMLCDFITISPPDQDQVMISVDLNKFRT